MKIVMIGASGHSGLCVSDCIREDRTFVAVAPGSRGESVEGMERRLREIGYMPTVYGDYREMLRKEKPDVAVVDNFYGEHGPVILDAFAAGCHVFAEKPAATAGMFTYRYDGAFYKAWQLIRQGAIGKVRLLNAQKSYKFGTRPDFMSRRETYGGTIPWVGIHGIDWILWMSGGHFTSVTAVQSAAEAPNGVCPETTALAQFQMEGGVMASLTVDYLNPVAVPFHGDDRIRVVGTEGVVEVRYNGVTLLDRNGVQHPQNLPEGDFFSDFLAQAAGKGRCRVSAEETFASTRAALLAQRAADSGEMVCF